MNVLRTELAEDPLGLGYAPHIANDNDQALADMLNEVREGVQVSRMIPLADIEEYLTTNMKFGALRRSTSEIAQDAVDYIRSPRFENLDPANQTAWAMFDALIGLSLLTVADKTHIQDMGVRPGSRAEQLGLGHVAATDIARAVRDDFGNPLIGG